MGWCWREYIQVLETVILFGPQRWGGRTNCEPEKWAETNYVVVFTENSPRDEIFSLSFMKSTSLQVPPISFGTSGPIQLHRLRIHFSPQPTLLRQPGRGQHLHPAGSEEAASGLRLPVYSRVTLTKTVPPWFWNIINLIHLSRHESYRTTAKAKPPAHRWDFSRNFPQALSNLLLILWPLADSFT